MLKQIKLLTGIELSSAYGFNEMKYGTDKKKKKHFKSLIASYILIGVMLSLYTGIFAFFVVFSASAKSLPPILVTIASAMIFFFSLFKAGSSIFDTQAFERTVVLPVKPESIVISRFLSLYISELIFSVFIMLPGSIIYAIFVHPSFMFYLTTILGIFTVPLIPLTLATILGAFITGVTAKLKFKKTISTVFTFLLIIVLIVLPQIISRQMVNLTDEFARNISATLSENSMKYYPPSALYSGAAVDNNILYLLAFVLISVALITLFVFVIKNKFINICILLSASSSKNNYKMHSQKRNSVIKALYFKEIKRFFSSKNYILNTLMGEILMILISCAILFLGIDTFGEYFFSADILKIILPLVLSLFISLSPTTACAISLEGKQFWVVQSLPVSAKNVFDSKILVNLTMGFCAQIVCSIILIFALKPNIYLALEIIIVPLVYCIFSSVSALSMNIHNPILEWDNEITVIKQSSSTIFSMLISLASIILPATLCIMLPAYKEIILLCVCAILLIITAIIYKSFIKIKLSSIH